MKCDSCGKEVEQPAVLLAIPDFDEETKCNLGKYYGTKTNVNGMLTWCFCFECVLDKFLGLPGAAELGSTTPLTKQEQVVLALVAQGCTNSEIATSLFLSEHTVKVHVRNIMGKLHAHTRQQAAYKGFLYAEEKELLRR